MLDCNILCILIFLFPMRVIDIFNTFFCSDDDMDEEEDQVKPCSIERQRSRSRSRSPIKQHCLSQQPPAWAPAGGGALVPGVPPPPLPQLSSIPPPPQRQQLMAQDAGAQPQMSGLPPPIPPVPAVPRAATSAFHPQSLSSDAVPSHAASSSSIQLPPKEKRASRVKNFLFGKKKPTSHWRSAPGPGGYEKQTKLDLILIMQILQVY